MSCAKPLICLRIPLLARIEGDRHASGVCRWRNGRSKPSARGSPVGWHHKAFDFSRGLFTIGVPVHDAAGAYGRGRSPFSKPPGVFKSFRLGWEPRDEVAPTALSSVYAKARRGSRQPTSPSRLSVCRSPLLRELPNSRCRVARSRGTKVTSAFSHCRAEI